MGRTGGVAEEPTAAARVRNSTITTSSQPFSPTFARRRAIHDELREVIRVGPLFRLGARWLKNRQVSSPLRYPLNGAWLDWPYKEAFASRGPAHVVSARNAR